MILKAGDSMKKRMIATAVLSVFLCTGISAPAEAAKSVSVTLPTFDVTLNGQVIENDNRQYPLLVYNNITYVPMTYYDCRFLGLETTWNQKDGLGIIKSDLTGAYYEDTVGKKNSRRSTAQIVSGTVKVNGKTINNASEKYPLLLYRDVTYFPLTWRFAVNEFGWKYQFDSKNGLVITSDNTHTESLILDDARSGEYDMFSYAVNNGYLYYEGKQGEIYRRPLDDWNNAAKREKMAQIEKDYESDAFYPKASIYAEGGSVYYRYHSGGPTMGKDLLYRISQDGTVSDDLIKGRVDIYEDFGSTRVQIPHYPVGNVPDKIFVTTLHGIDDGYTREIGEEYTTYYLCENGYDHHGQLLYVLAGDWNVELGVTREYYLHMLDIGTETFTKLFDEPVCKAKYCFDDELYIWQNLKRQVIDGIEIAGPESTYKYDLYWLNQKTGEKVLVDEVNSNCAINASGVYYQDTETKNLIFWNKKTEKATEVHGDNIISNIFSAEEYVIAAFKEKDDNHRRLMVFNTEGKQVYTSADVIDSASVSEDGILVYRLAGTNQLVKVQL